MEILKWTQVDKVPVALAFPSISEKQMHFTRSWVMGVRFVPSGKVSHGTRSPRGRQGSTTSAPVPTCPCVRSRGPHGPTPNDSRMEVSGGSETLTQAGRACHPPAFHLSGPEPRQWPATEKTTYPATSEGKGQFMKAPTCLHLCARVCNVDVCVHVCTRVHLCAYVDVCICVHV